MSNRDNLTGVILAQSASSDQVETPFVTGPIKDLIGGSLIIIGIVFVATAIAGRIGNWVELKSIQRQRLAGGSGVSLFILGFLAVFPLQQRNIPVDPEPPAQAEEVSKGAETLELSLDEDCKYKIDSTEMAKLVETECQRLLLNDPGNYEFLRNLGRAQLLIWDSQGNNAREEGLNEAIGNFESAVLGSNSQDGNSIFHYALALSIRHFENYDNEYEVGPAKDAYELALNIFTNPDIQIQNIDFTPMVETGHYFVKSCRYEEANQLYERVLEQDPNEYSALTSSLIALGEIAKQKKIDGEVLDFYNINELSRSNSIRLRSSSALRFNLGSVAVLQEDFESASSYYKDAHDLSETFPQALRNRALSLIVLNGVSEENLGLLDEAIEEAHRLNQNIEVPIVDNNSTQAEVAQLLLGFVGFFSDHNELSEEDPVVEVRHDILYPGAKCEEK